MKKTAVTLAFAVGVTSVPMGSVVLASSKPSYDDVFQIKGISSRYNNGGQYQQSNIALAFDGKTNTHWETGRPNGGNFKNHVIVGFKEVEEIGSISYYPRVSGEANKGYPVSFSVYGTMSTTDKDPNLEWELIHQEEKIGVASGELKIKFKEPVEYQRIKFVFDEVHGYGWAAASEFKFYKPDPLTDEVDSLFTDGTMSEVKKGITKDDLNTMMNEANKHPSKYLVEKVELAQDILANGSKKDEVFEIDLRGNDESHARNTLRMSSFGTNFLPTGYAAMAGQEVKIYVDVEEGQPLPHVVFTQQVGYWGKWRSGHIKLKQGENVFTVPKNHDAGWSHKVEAGGAIYLDYPYDVEVAPKVRIEGAHEYPIFNDGEDVDLFLEELKAYKEKVEKEPKKYVDIVEMLSDYVLINGNLQSASIFLKEENPRNPQDSMDYNNDMLKKYFALAGINDTNEDVKHNRMGARANMRLMQPWAFAYAWGDHTGFQQSTMNSIFGGYLYGWAEAHELGHHFDIKGAMIGEVTNNMWANYNRVLINGEPDRIVDSQYDAIFKKAGAYNHAELDRNGTNSLAVWWQLYLLDEDYWANYNTAIRAGKFDEFKVNNNERMVLASSYAIGYDLTEYFIRHKFINQATADKLKPMLEKLGVKELPADLKPWYMHTKAALDRNAKFTKAYTPEIVEIKKVGNNLQFKLNIDESAQDALLGYEVLEDGKVLGFTKTNTFTSIQAVDNDEHVYTVRAYDLRQNVTGYSEGVVFDSGEPQIKITKSTIIPVNADVYVEQHAVATDVYGKELDLQVVKDLVKTDVTGTYTVKYGAIDAERSKTGYKDITYNTVSEIVYASDMKESFVSTGYNGLQKNKKIESNQKMTLLLNGKEVAYDKGLGAHADSKIEYQLDGAYDLFEAFIGVEGAMRNSKDPSVSFQVIADGKVIYESDMFYAKTEQEYVKLNIRGVSKLTLVTKSHGSKNSDHSVWADAKFARIEAEKSEMAILREVQSILKDSFKGVNLDQVQMIRYNPVIAYPTNTEEEALVMERLNEALKDKYTGSLNIFVTNMDKAYKNVDDLIQNGSTISYKKLNGTHSHILNGDAFVQGSW